MLWPGGVSRPWLSVPLPAGELPAVADLENRAGAGVVRGSVRADRGRANSRRVMRPLAGVQQFLIVQRLRSMRAFQPLARAQESRSSRPFNAVLFPTLFPSGPASRRRTCP